MKKMLMALTVSAALSPLAGQAGVSLMDGEVSGSIGFTTDYAFRGISQSDQNPAIQGSLDYALPLSESTSLYAGIWGSSIDFNDGDEAHLETDLYLGLSHAMDNWTFDVSGIYYAYPGAESNLDYDFWELMGTIGYDFGVAALATSINWSPEYFGDSGDAYFYQAGLSIPGAETIGVEELSLDATIGFQDIDDNAAFGVPDYTTWSVGINYDVDPVTISTQYIDTDLSETECSGICDSRFVLSVGASF